MLNWPIPTRTYEAPKPAQQSSVSSSPSAKDATGAKYAYSDVLLNYASNAKLTPLMMNVVAEGVPIRACGDTGAGATFISNSMCNTLINKGVISDIETSFAQFRTANNEPIAIEGCVRLKFWLGPDPPKSTNMKDLHRYEKHRARAQAAAVTVTAYVLPNLPFDAILGNNVLKHIRATINFRNNTITSTFGQIKFDIGDSNDSLPKISSVQSRWVQSRSLMMIQGRISNHKIDSTKSQPGVIHQTFTRNGINSYYWRQRSILVSSREF